VPGPCRKQNMYHTSDYHAYRGTHGDQLIMWHTLTQKKGIPELVEGSASQEQVNAQECKQVHVGQ
jgi:hypothetical protein